MTCPICNSKLSHMEKKFQKEHIKSCKKLSHYHDVSGYGHYSECNKKECHEQN